MTNFYLARQLLRRDWRAGELATLLYALVIAVAAALTIALVSERLGAALGKESAELLGGDLVIDSTREPDPQWQDWGAELGMASAQVQLFDSVLFYGDELLLCSVKAVDERYPLLGRMAVSTGENSPAELTGNIPEPGTTWVDARVLERLGASLGTNLHFGAMVLTVTKILNSEPDQANGLFQFAPRVLVNSADLAAAQVQGPGSRIRYKTLFRDDSQSGGKNLLAFKKRLKLGIGHNLVEPGNSENRAAAALVKTSQYIRIATLLAIVLAAIAIALSSRRYSERNYDVSAMLRCLGARRNAIIALYAQQLLLITLAAIAIGGLLGWVAHLALLAVLKPLLPQALPAAGFSPWLAAAGSALLLIAGFALPPILRLADTSPLRVLRRDLSPPPLAMWLAYGLAALAFGLLLWLLFDDLPTILLVLLATALALLACGTGMYFALRKLAKITTGAGLLARASRNLGNHAATSTSQIMAFALTLMLVLLAGQLRSGLLEEWRVQLPANAPNYFAFNLFDDEIAPLRAILENKADLKPFYPVVRGRIQAVNGDESAIRAGGDNDRELNFTWAEQLPKDNDVVSGTWPPTQEGVSLEQGYAERLGLKLGDSLTLDAGGDRFSATITSLRTVEWESFSPNFYLIFPRQALADKPAAYLTSFYLPAGNNALLAELVRSFPAMTLIEVDSILARMALILNQVSLSVELVMAFVLLSGLAVLYATLQTTAHERLREGALMRAFGASRQYLRRACWVEFGLLGGIAGGLAILGSEVASAIIYTRVFDLPFQPSPVLWFAVPLATAALVALAGYWGNLRVLATSPMMLLND